MALISLVCFECKKEDQFDRVGFRQECSACGADLHVCLNCRFYDEASYNECVETSADRIKVKDRSNLCEFFQAAVNKAGQQSEKDALLAAAEALFKK